MTSITAGLYIGRDALMAQQTAINVTGQNISNVNTPGYSRQRVNFENTSVQTSEGSVGTGVRVTSVNRVVDQFINADINTALQQKGAWEAMQQATDQTNNIFTETATQGISQQMSKFWNAWQDVSNNPSGYSERSALLTQSQTLTSNIQNVYKSLTQVQTDMDGHVTDAVNQINTLASQIGKLNDQIALSETSSGTSANDLRDQRDALLNQLSQKINLTSSEDPATGRVTVTLGDGHVLVGTSPYGKLSTMVNASSGYHDVVWDTAPTTSINGSITAGNLNGWITARDTTVAGYKTQLNTLAAQLIQSVNTLHTAGTGLDGSTGNNFFSGASASDIQVNPTISGNVNKIAAAAPGAAPNVLNGDNTQAVAIVNLQNSLTMSGNTTTFGAYYSSLVSSAGTDSKNAASNFTQQTTAVTQMQNLQASVSGVSTDEEMVNLIQYQHAYSAAAKLVDTVTQMMDTVLNMVR